MLIRRRVAASLVGVALALAGASCSSDKDSKTPASSAPAATTGSSATNAGADSTTAVPSTSTGGPATDSTAAIPSTTAAPSTTAQQPAPKGTLRYGFLADPQTFDPRMALDGSEVDLMPVYDTLTTLAAGETEPWLATAWTRVNPTTWRLSLRDDVVFQDGSKFDAAALKLNWDTAKAITTSPHATFFGNIDSVTVVDPTTADVVLKVPNPSFPQDIAGLSGAMVSPTALTSGADLSKTPAGSGGWMLDQGATHQGTTVFTANPSYWNPGAIGVEQIEVLAIPDENARLNAMQTGQIQIASISNAALAQPLIDDGFKLLVQTTRTEVLIIADRDGQLSKPLADVRVRNALSLLFDCNGYNQALFDGRYDCSDRGIAAVDSPWHTDETADLLVGPNVDQAKALLTEAGYPDGFELTVASSPVIQQRLQTIAQMWAKGGVTLKLDDVGADIVTPMRQGKTPIGFSIVRGVDPNTWYYQVASNRSPLYNPFKLTDTADLDVKMDEAATLGSDSERKASYDDMQVQIVNDGIVIPLVVGEVNSLASPKISGYQYWTPTDLSPRPYGVRFTS